MEWMGWAIFLEGWDGGGFLNEIWGIYRVHERSGGVVSACTIEDRASRPEGMDD